MFEKEMSAIDQIQKKLDRVGRELRKDNTKYYLQRELVGEARGLRFALEMVKKELPFSVRKDGEMEFNVGEFGGKK